MNFRLKRTVHRTVFITVMLMLTAALAVLGVMLENDSGYGACSVTPAVNNGDAPANLLSAIEEPDYSYNVYTMTFMGGLNLGSMLGSSSYGTLNSVYSEQGGEYFLSDLGEITGQDSVTLAYLDSVFSDSADLTPSEKSGGEVGWYLAPAKNADILSLGGVDALSLECTGARDYGEDGLGDTKAALEEIGIVWGSSVRAIYLDAYEGIKVAVYPCAYREENIPGILSWIERAGESNDYTVVMISRQGESGGEEEAFHSFIDAGASLVVATDFESFGEVEEYGGGYIVYSLGSLIDGRNMYSEKTTSLLQAELIIYGGEIRDVSYSLIPVGCYTEREHWKPYIID